MGSVKDNLIAARALIDTPEKYRLTSVGAAMSITAADDETWGHLAVCLPIGVDFFGDFERNPGITHPDIMALFDRAIAACDAQVAA